MIALAEMVKMSIADDGNIGNKIPSISTSPWKTILNNSLNTHAPSWLAWANEGV